MATDEGGYDEGSYDEGSLWARQMSEIKRGNGWYLSQV